MSKISNISGLNVGMTSLAKEISALKTEAIKNSKKLALATKEIEKLNKHNESERIAKMPKETTEAYPLVNYEPNEMTFSQMMLRKLDIV